MENHYKIENEKVSFKKSKSKTLFLDICGKIGFYPKRITFRASTRYAKKIFGNKPILVCEIGVDEGKNALNILKNLNVKKIYLVDPYVEYKDFLDSAPHKTNENLRLAYRKAINNLRNYKEKVVQIREFSEDAINKIPECDFIYIDGNHTYDYIKKDIELYFKKIKKEGILAGHDIEEKDVFKAFSEFVVKNKLNAWITYPDWIIKKN